MPIIVGGVALEKFDAASVFDALESKCQNYVDDIKSRRLDAVAIKELQGKLAQSIGSIEATSCINVCYLNNKHIVIHHHDYEGRNKDPIRDIFAAHFKDPDAMIEVALIGGCKETDLQRREENRKNKIGENSYQALHLRTRKIFEDLISFWESLGRRFAIQGWIRGGDSQESLCSDFVVDCKGRISLVETGVIRQNQKIPESIRRTAAFMGVFKYFHPYNSSNPRILSLEKLELDNFDKGFLNTVVPKIEAAKTDREVGEAVCVTTPEIEPVGFYDRIRDVPRYIDGLYPKINVEAVEIELPPGPIIILQGEVGHLEKKDDI